jgi:uncharacterized membrane protein YhhN
MNKTLWLAASTAACALLAMLGASWASPALLFVFKPLTTLLIVAFAWQRGDAPRRRRFVLLGLVLSLLGDVALLWPREGFVPGLVCFLGAHLAYLVAFTVGARLAVRPLVFVAYAAVAGVLLALLWPGVPPALRAPVLTYVLCLSAMAAQATCWALVDGGLARRAAIGAALFMGSDTILAFDRFSLPVPAASVAILATYWLAQWLIAASLRPRAAAAAGRPVQPQTEQA